MKFDVQRDLDNVRCTVAVALLFFAGCGDLHADFLEEMGFNDLRNALGTVLPDGNGVGVVQIEAKVGGDYLPQEGSGTFPGNGNFLGKIFTAESPGADGVSGHSATVGSYFYGNETNPASGIASMAPGVTDIDCFWNFDYITDTLGSGADKKVHCHSWASPDLGEELLESLDFAIDANGFLAVTGMRNGIGSAVPELPSSAYNVISVGRSDGVHSSGFTSTTLATSGRIKPEVVAPYGTTSYAVAGVSSLAAVLYEVAADDPQLESAFNESEVMKAIIMAGATKDEFPGWSRTETVPLDMKFGAGEVNVHKSYQILKGGRQTAGGAVGIHGWDAGSVPPGSLTQQDYAFTVPPGLMANEVSIVLTWNRAGAAGTVSDLNLQLLRAASTLEWDASRSVVDNVEHIFYRNLPPGSYVIRVKRKGNAVLTSEYGLAWRMEMGKGPQVAMVVEGGDNVLNLTHLDPGVEYRVVRYEGVPALGVPTVETVAPSSSQASWIDTGAADGDYSYYLEWRPVLNGAEPLLDNGGPPRPAAAIDPPIGTVVNLANLHPGQECVIERSGDLRHWEEVHTFTPSGTDYSWIEPRKGEGSRYFRLKMEAAGPMDSEMSVAPETGVKLRFDHLETGADYRVERTSDFEDWEEAGQFNSPGPTFHWKIDSTPDPASYFRLVLVNWTPVLKAVPTPP